MGEDRQMDHRERLVIMSRWVRTYSWITKKDRWLCFDGWGQTNGSPGRPVIMSRWMRTEIWITEKDWWLCPDGWGQTDGLCLDGWGRTAGSQRKTGDYVSMDEDRQMDHREDWWLCLDGWGQTDGSQRKTGDYVQMGEDRQMDYRERLVIVSSWVKTDRWITEKDWWLCLGGWGQTDGSQRKTGDYVQMGKDRQIDHREKTGVYVQMGEDRQMDHRERLVIMSRWMRTDRWITEKDWWLYLDKWGRTDGSQRKTGDYV